MRSTSSEGAPASSPADQAASRRLGRRDGGGSAAGAAAFHTVVIALGSNLGDLRYNLLRAVHALRELVRIVRVSKIRETAPVDAPAGSPHFLNMAIVGYTTLAPAELLEELLTLEKRLGRQRRRIRNEPRVIDLDLILHGAHRVRSEALTLPHPRYRQRRFVMEPLLEISAFPAPSPTPPPRARAGWPRPS